jgi:hypothetical protein
VFVLATFVVVELTSCARAVRTELVVPEVAVTVEKSVVPPMALNANGPAVVNPVWAVTVFRSVVPLLE